MSTTNLSGTAGYRRDSPLPRTATVSVEGTNSDAYGKALLGVVEEDIRSGVFRSDPYVPGGRNTLIEMGDAFATMALAGLRP